MSWDGILSKLKLSNQCHRATKLLPCLGSSPLPPMRLCTCSPVSFLHSIPDGEPRAKPPPRTGQGCPGHRAVVRHWSKASVPSGKLGVGSIPTALPSLSPGFASAWCQSSVWAPRSSRTFAGGIPLPLHLETLVETCSLRPFSFSCLAGSRPAADPGTGVLSTPGLYSSD